VYNVNIIVGVVVRPTITLPFASITTQEHKTVNFDCLTTATSQPGWTMFSWLKNGDTIRPNVNKYKNITEPNPDKSNENSIKSVLTIYNISIEDEANYTCIVYYNPDVLKKFKIDSEFSDQETASLQVNLTSNVYSCYVCLCVCMCMHVCQADQ